MVNDKNNNALLIGIGIVLLIVFIGKTQFLGTLVTTCDNQEPTSFTAYQGVLDQLNGTVDSIAPVTVLAEEGLVGYPTYTTNSSLGMFDIVDLQTIECDAFLAIVDQQNTGTQYVVLNQRQVLLTDGGYMWCNNINNIALRTTSVTTFANYYDEFEVCVSQEVDDASQAYVADEDTCDALDGNWTDNQCLCEERRMRITDTACEITVEGREGTGDDDDDDSGGSSSSGSTTGSTAVPSIPLETTTSTTGREGYTTQQKLTGAGIILVVAFLLYWFFERGPDKGLIKRRRRRK